jgi:erythromycin esterase-like protein
LPDSYENLLHRSGGGRFVLVLRDAAAMKPLVPQRLERAIGVIYLPESERTSHYFTATLTRQFDAVIHLDQTSALEPLDSLEQATSAGVPEAYPSGL